MYPNIPFQQNMYQQRLNNLQYGMNVPMYIVHSADEVSNAPFNFDGSRTYFLCREQETIYSKEMDNDGRPVIRAYRLAPQEKVRTTDDRLSDIEKQIAMLTSLVTTKEVSDEHNAVNAAGAQSAVGDAADEQ